MLHTEMALIGMSDQISEMFWYTHKTYRPLTAASSVWQQDQLKNLVTQLRSLPDDNLQERIR